MHVTSLETIKYSTILMYNFYFYSNMVTDHWFGEGDEPLMVDGERRGGEGGKEE